MELAKEHPLALPRSTDRMESREQAWSTRNSLELLHGATHTLSSLALEGRVFSICAALIVNMAAFSLWWMLCYCFDTHSLWLYLPALLLAHPLALLALGSKLSAGALIAANRRGEPSGVDLERLRRPLPPIEILRGDEGLLLKFLRR
ncbi:MAG: hypothetical protein JXA37_02540 [Chloroflexia bacterium]|nr:hypothetical protein [Chloroflexia bacterium]